MSSLPPDEDLARRRWMTINAVRIGGVVLTVLGVFIVRGVIALPEEAGYLLLGIGLIDLFLVPAFLVRKWRSPRQ